MQRMKMKIKSWFIHNDFGAFLLAMNGIILNMKVFLNTLDKTFGWGVIKLQEDFYDSVRFSVKWRFVDNLGYLDSLVTITLTVLGITNEIQMTDFGYMGYYAVSLWLVGVKYSLSFLSSL